MKVELVLETDLERLLGFPISSDPRQSRFPIPEAPSGEASYAAGYIEITPEIAQDWVTHRLFLDSHTPKELRHDEQRHNRIVSIPYARSWQRKFEAGDYDPSVPDDLCFTPDGYILDSQHRMLGGFLARVTWRMSVKTNVPWNTFAKMGTGLRRAPAQFLHGYTHRPIVAGAVRHILPITRMSEARDVTLSPRDGEEMLEVANAFPWLRGGWIGDCKRASGEAYIPSGALAAHVVMALAAGAEENWVQEFINGATTGVNLTMDDPRYVMREAFRRMHNQRVRLKETGKPSRAVQAEQVAYIRQAMTAWLDTKSLNKLTYNGKLPPVWNADAVRHYYKGKTA